MLFGIFCMSVENTDGCPKVTFTSLRSIDETGPLRIEADDVAGAVEQSLKLLKQFGMESHSVRGSYDVQQSYFPDYFVGEIPIEVALDHLSPGLENRVSQFTPVGEINR